MFLGGRRWKEAGKMILRLIDVVCNPYQEIANIYGWNKYSYLVAYLGKEESGFIFHWIDIEYQFHELNTVTALPKWKLSFFEGVWRYLPNELDDLAIRTTGELLLHPVGTSNCSDTSGGTLLEYLSLMECAPAWSKVHHATQRNLTVFFSFLFSQVAFIAIYHLISKPSFFWLFSSLFQLRISITNCANMKLTVGISSSQFELSNLCDNHGSTFILPYTQLSQQLGMNSLMPIRAFSSTQDFSSRLSFEMQTLEKETLRNLFKLGLF